MKLEEGRDERGRGEEETEGEAGIGTIIDPIKVNIYIFTRLSSKIAYMYDIDSLQEIYLYSPRALDFEMEKNCRKLKISVNVLEYI